MHSGPPSPARRFPLTQWGGLGLCLGVALACSREPPLAIDSRSEGHGADEPSREAPQEGGAAFDPNTDEPSAGEPNADGSDAAALDASSEGEARPAYEALLPDPADYDGSVPECGANQVPCLGVCVDLTPDPCGAYSLCVEGRGAGGALPAVAAGEEQVDRLGVGRGGAWLSLAQDGSAMVVWVARDWKRLCGRHFDAATARWDDAAEIDVAERQVQIIGMDSDLDGDVVFTWVKREGSDPPLERLMYRRFDASSATWQGDTEVSHIDLRQGTFEPGSLELDAQGQALLVWGTVRPGPDDSASEGQLYASLLGEDGQALTNPRELTRGLRNNRYFPDARLTPAGDAWVVWTEGTGDARSVRARHYDRALADWSGPAILDEGSGQVNVARVAQTATGAAVAAWVAADSTAIVTSRFEPELGSWSSRARLDDDDAQDGPVEIALSEAGHAFATWRNHGVRDGRRGDVFVADSAPGASAWSAPTRLSLSVEPGNPPAIAVDPEGNATVVWIARDETGGSLYAQTYSARDGAWGEARVLTSTVHGTWADMRPNVLADAQGGLTVLFTDPVVPETLNRNYPVRVNVVRFEP